MNERITGTLEMRGTALDPIHHGAGSIGNVSVARRQAFLLDDGSEVRVPYISGNSIKHLIRDGGARFACEALDIADGALSKGIVDLLFSGGGLTKGGSAVNIAKARDLERMFPLLSVCGYGAGNTMTASRVRPSHMHVVCAENAFRLPADLVSHAHTQLRAEDLITEEFGTRHDTRSDGTVTRMLDLETRTTLEGAMAAKSKDKTASAKAEQSSQMIYEFEAIKAGSRLYGTIQIIDMNPLEIGALQSALGRACVGMHGDAHVFRLGGKSSVGFGRVAITFTGALRHIERPATSESTELARIGSDSASTHIAAYLDHIRANRADIIEALQEACE